MGTLTENILARGCGKASVRPGEIVDVRVDKAMIHDNNAGLVIKNFRNIVGATVWNPDRVVFVIDHHSPSSTVKAVKHHQTARRFAKENGITKFYDCGSGISHIVMLEEGLAGRGEIVVGTDSHTTGEGALGAFATGIGATEMAVVLATGTVWFMVPETIRVVLNGAMPAGIDARDVMNAVLARFGPDGANYCAVEFHGPAAMAMSIEERAMCCALAMEMGAKNALFADAGEADAGARYSRVEEFDVSSMEQTVAVPDLPTNAKPLREIAAQRIPIDQAFVGACTGGLLRDIEAAATALKGKKVAPGVRLLVIPATRRIYAAALEKGYLQTLHEAGAILGSPACGACGGHDAGILAEGEVCIAASTRNMDGRMGAGGKVYLASAAVVAASAARGYITGDAGEGGR
ncbi:MAG: 3-isopropylmalate dehydratase large subunit [Planctomycetota bacterium]|nr:3-isopropylmalate dehydratase large subunit [Planctomycetota bacterium]